MNKEFDLLVFCGRFQPFHTQHKRVIDVALEKSKNVLILIGSAGRARTIRNPFTFTERMNMICDAYNQDIYLGSQQNLFIRPLYDKTYNDLAWIKQIQDIVKDTALEINNCGGFNLHGMKDMKIGLIGASKDHTSYYLKLFPQWESVDVPIQSFIHATGIREAYFEGTSQKHELWNNELPPSVCNFLFNEFKYTDSYVQLQNEVKFVKKYKKSWKAAPYPVKHVTVDAVVEQSGHILLVKRRSEPGKGLWALPGGHLDEHETVENGILRELREETLIKVPDAVLRGNIEQIKVFDDPHRSTLGRVITHAAYIKLPDQEKLPKIKGSDDAEKAKWIPIGDLKEDQMFDDHYYIICNFLGI